MPSELPRAAIASPEWLKIANVSSFFRVRSWPPCSAVVSEPCSSASFAEAAYNDSDVTGEIEACADDIRSSSSLGQPAQLAVDQLIIGATATHQHLWRTVLDQPAPLQHQDAIEVAQGRQPMGNGDHGAAAHEIFQSFANGLL